MRLEDLVLVTEDGAENLTDFPYDLDAVSTKHADDRDACYSRSGGTRRRPSSPRRRTRSRRSTSAAFEEFWEREGRERVTWFEPFTELLRVGAARTRSGTSAAS